MEAPINSYEDLRRKRVEENLKKIQGLGISRISSSLLEVAESESKQLKFHASSKEKKLLDTSELRRSSRMRNQVPSYDDNVVDFGITRSYWRRSYNSEPIGREYTGRIASYEEKVHAVKRAEILLSQVAYNHPSFVKSMLRSHVSSCFWLGLPTKFCKDHLPLQGTTMVLEDEKGEEHESIYIGRRTGLSGGWRSFAVDHKLEDGDALVFKLIEPTRFKVYIVKAIVGSVEAEDESGPVGNDCVSIKSPESEFLSCESQSSCITKQFLQNEPSELTKNARRRKQSQPRPSN